MNTSAVKPLFTYNYKYNIHLKYTRTYVIFKFSGVFCKNSIDGQAKLWNPPQDRDFNILVLTFDIRLRNTKVRVSSTLECFHSYLKLC